MSKRRVKTEAMENVGRVINQDKVDVVGTVGAITADAYAESVRNQEHVDEINKELTDKANKTGTTVRKEEEPKEPVNNIYTAKLVLDESSMREFIHEEATTDGRSRKVYDDDDEDDHLDYDMFDFIYGLVTDTWPKPLNPLNHRLRKFMYSGSDDYIKTNSYTGRPQVAARDDKIEVYSDVADDFNDIIEICKLYGFKYDGPTPKASKASKWNFSFRITVPSINGYPMMVADYFEDRGMTLEDVMPADFCKQYRKKEAKINKEVEARLAEKEVDKKVAAAIMNAARDGTTPLKTHLDMLINDLKQSGLKYSPTKVKQTFMDAFADDYED